MINQLKKLWLWLISDEVGDGMDETISRGVKPKGSEEAHFNEACEVAMAKRAKLRKDDERLECNLPKERINEIASKSLQKVIDNYADQDKQMFEKYMLSRKEVWTSKGGAWHKVCDECSGSGWAPRSSGVIFDGKRQLHRHIVDCPNKCTKCQGRVWVN